MATITGTSGNDNIGAWGTTGGVTGGAATSGNDLIDGSAGNDTIEGGSGRDTLIGGLGNDLLYSTDTVGDSMSGGAGLDTLQAGPGDDTLDGGDGDDRIWADGGNNIATGGAGNDMLSAQSYTGNNLLDGGTGSDSLYGGIGIDTLLGGDGDDTLYSSDTIGDSLDGGAGNDYLQGSSGHDTLSGGIGSDTLYVHAGNDSASGGDGNDLISGQGHAGNKLLDGGAGDDSLYGGNGADTLLGGDGNDMLYTGDAVGDWLDGGAGSDVLQGSSGNDTLVVGVGHDAAFGGTGDDTYRITGREFSIFDAGGNDTAIVSADYVKLPGGIENVQYVDGAKPLPYWIDGLLFGAGNGDTFQQLLGPAREFRFGFATAVPTYFSAGDATGFSAFTEAQKTFTRATLAYVSSVVGLRFIETTDLEQNNTLVFANGTRYGTSASGYAYGPAGAPIGNDVIINSIFSNNLAPTDGSFAALTLIHEIGHALGLKHSFEQDGLPGTVLNATEDSTQWTVMSYSQAPANYRAELRPFDIAALQYLYGPSDTGRTGDDRWALDAAGSNFLWDGGGNDTVDGSALTQSLVLSLNPGEWGWIGSKTTLFSGAGQVTVNFGSTLENALGGSGNDQLTGNAVGNLLDGGAGNDTLAGGAGNDSLVGGTGDDLFDGGAGDDVLTGGAGTDAAVFHGLRASYQITGFLDGATVSGADGVDRLSGVEQLRFDDMTLTLAPPAALSGMVYAWKGHQLLGNTGVQATPVAGGAASTQVTDSTGSFRLAGLPDGNYAVAASRPASDAGNAITSADALAALRIAIGANPNGGTLKLSPYQVLAADVNGDGRVTSADALAILRMAIKSPGATAPAWTFVQERQDLWDETTGSSLVTRSASTLPAAPSVAQDATANLVGILKGDVNGSWTLAGSAKVEDSDAAYFTKLASSLQVPTDIWGL